VLTAAGTGADRDEDATRKVVRLRKPLGVVAAITAWNVPIILLAVKVGPALLAGNTVVAKPAPTTPLTPLRFGELCARILPPGAANVIADQSDLGAVLTGHPDVSQVAFTGSTATGRKVMAGAAGTLKRLSLELGGNDAAVVLDDADPKEVAPKIYSDAMANAGQACVAVKRLYVHESLYDAVCDELGRLARKAVVGDGLEPGTQMGPLQNRAQFERVKGFLEDARRSGTVVAGGLLDREGYFVRPTPWSGDAAAHLPRAGRTADVAQRRPSVRARPRRALHHRTGDRRASGVAQYLPGRRNNLPGRRGRLTSW
jgi:acyl-CoA reductase-like NAD-dependent aldehyde dehydrogenase